MSSITSNKPCSVSMSAIRAAIVYTCKAAEWAIIEIIEIAMAHAIIEIAMAHATIIVAMDYP